MDIDIFYPEGKGPAMRTAELAAKAVCYECPVRLECLAEAESIPEPWGVWGGLSEDERGWERARDALQKPFRSAGEPPSALPADYHTTHT